MSQKKEVTPQPTSNPSLPDDLLMSCLARVSRSYYRILSLVSKSFGSLGHTESCLYVCLTSYSDTHWFTLCWKPDQTIMTNDTSMKKKKSSGYYLARVPIPHSPRAYFPSLVAVGSDIYNIGSNSRYDLTSSSVSVMDCRSHKWHEAPSMRVGLASLSASFIDGKIYVAGSSGIYAKKNSFEVFDTKTKTWDPEPPISCSMTECSFSHSRSSCIDGKFHVVAADKNAVAYNSKEGRWDQVERRMCHYMFLRCYCEIENVLYSAFKSAIRWYDTNAKEWRDLMGLVGLPKLPPCYFVRLADYGGKLAVLWEEDIPSSGEKMIWSAEIMLERRKNHIIWGKVEWYDYVLTVPKGYYFVKVLAAIV
ncbi:hypothetical protein EUTSA_v10021944mg [Eutrema salsugineum]|uniref:Uncharacterized protein n=1 Tax=Eutrema salsugineum TaxID=72664 RepID=V4NM74_EUTSA|nr:hypothetical protein EUTSA_v10021944mg [Eutrema salsugineum]